MDSRQSADAETGFKLSDPQKRDVTQLLESAKKSRSANRVVEAIILAYLALKASEADQNTGAFMQAQAHLFLSESMGELGYRAMERIHAKAAYRALQRNTSAEHNLETGHFYFRLGVVAKESGNYSIAGYYLKRALASFETARPPNSRGMILTLTELARLSIKEADIHRILERGGLEKLNLAQKYVDRAISLTEKIKDDREITESIIDLQAHMILRLISHLPEENRKLVNTMLSSAEKMLRESINRRRSRPDSSLRERLPVMNDLVSILRRTGRYVEAMEVVNEMLKITDQLQRVDIDVVLNMALVSTKLADDNLTRTLCNIVMNSEEARIAEVSSLSSEAVALAFSTQARQRSMKCLSVLSMSVSRDEKSARQMLDIVFRRKAIITDAEEKFWKTLHGQSDADLRSARANLILLRNRISTKVASGDSVGLWQLIRDVENAEEVLAVTPWWRTFQSKGADAEQQALKDYAESILKGMKPWDAVPEQKLEPENPRVNIEMIAGNLPYDAVLLEFVKIDDFDIERDIFLESARYWAIILHSDGKIKAVDLGNADHIEREIGTNLKAFHSTDRLLPGPQLEAMSNLYNVAWSPFDDELKGVNSIIISPDAVFALMPFGALLTPDGRFLIEHFTLYQIATGRDLAVSKKPTSGKPNNPVIVVDPDFDAGVNSSTQNHRRKSIYFMDHKPLVRLEETRKEGEKIKEILGENAEILTRDDASEKKVRDISSPRVFHLATHGLFIEDKIHPEQGLSEEDAVARNASYVRHVRALSRSGIALSGINRGGKESDDDGLLTAFDVAAMDLSHTDLVVLSACDTGLGDVLAGEGVLGLRRSFRIAGARYVLMSLWRLSDKEAVRQMRAFYSDYVAGVNPVLALRDMQRTRIKRLREVLGHAPPALWGALISQGLEITQ